MRVPFQKQPPEEFSEKVLLEISQNSQKNRVSFSIKLQALDNFVACNFIKKETLAQTFSCEFCEISKNTFFTKPLWATACILYISKWRYIHIVSEAFIKTFYIPTFIESFFEKFMLYFVYLNAMKVRFIKLQTNFTITVIWQTGTWSQYTFIFTVWSLESSKF